MLKGILIGILLGLAGVFVCAYLYFSSGRAPVTTNSPEMPFEHKFANMALRAYLAKQPHPNPPIPQDEKNYMEGAKIYKEHCSICHGLPNQPRGPIPEGMFPKPPELFHGVGVTDDEPWETYYKVAGGMRMTGMPSFKSHLNDTEMWQVSVLLKNADKLPDSVKAELSKPEGPEPADHETKPGEEHKHQHPH